MTLFNVYYAIVSYESVQDGDYSETGTIGEGLTLRDAIKEFTATRTNAVDGQSIEDSGRYWVACNGMEFETGDYESRALQPAGRITESSYRRISRLLGV